MADVDRSNPNDLSAIFVRGRAGDMVPLSNLVSVREAVAPKELNHFNKLRSGDHPPRRWRRATRWATR